MNEPSGTVSRAQLKTAGERERDRVGERERGRERSAGGLTEVCGHSLATPGSS